MGAPDGEALYAPLTAWDQRLLHKYLGGGQGRERPHGGPGRTLLEGDHGFPAPQTPLDENGFQMEPLHHFLVDLENFLDQRGYEISSSYPNDMELREKETGKLVGYWPTTINYENFRETK